MKAMILAAGLGTRLMPLTEHKPKALVEVNGIPMLEIVLKRLVRNGFDEIIINVHHFADLILKYLQNNPVPGVRIEISDETGKLLDTGGAILKARWFLDGNDPFLLHNTDVLSEIDLRELMKRHSQKDPLATLAVSSRNSSRHFLLDHDMRLRGWENACTKELILTGIDPNSLKKFAFSGIHVISPEIYKHITQTGNFSIVQTYLQLCASHRILGYLHKADSWFDLGKKDQIEKAESFLRSHPNFK
jgi:NDP-sugar pyrophosphorylase family protein